MAHRLLSVLFGFGVAFALSELVARVVLQPPLGDRVAITDKATGLRADCYPRARGVSLPLDMERPEDRVTLFKPMTRPGVLWPNDATWDREALAAISSIADVVERLRWVAPLCVPYDDRESSPRRLIPGPKSGAVAVLGDSFAFGHVRKLSPRVGARARSAVAGRAAEPQRKREKE